MHLLTDAGEDEDERTEENGIRSKMRSLYRLRGDNMTNITVYDTEAKKLKEISEKYNITVAEVVEAAMIALDDAYAEDSWDEEYI